MSSLGLFVTIMAVGAVLYFVLRGRSDLPKAIGEPKRAMSTGRLDAVTFDCPYTKCPVCAGAADKMKQDWDGLRKVRWTCGYCGNTSDQGLKDDELPLSARIRLGMSPPPNASSHGRGANPFASGAASGIDAPLE